MLKRVSYRNEKLPRSSVGFITCQFVLELRKQFSKKRSLSEINYLESVRLRESWNCFLPRNWLNLKVTVIKGILKLIDSIDAYI